MGPLNKHSSAGGHAKRISPNSIGQPKRPVLADYLSHASSVCTTLRRQSETPYPRHEAWTPRHLAPCGLAALNHFARTTEKCLGKNIFLSIGGRTPYNRSAQTAQRGSACPDAGALALTRPSRPARSPSRNRSSHCTASARILRTAPTPHSPRSPGTPPTV